MEPIRAQMRANAYRGDHEVLQNLAPLAPSAKTRTEISREASNM